MIWPEALQELIEEFIEIEDKFEKLEVLMDFSSEVIELPSDEWNESNRVESPQCMLVFKELLSRPVSRNPKMESGSGRF